MRVKKIITFCLMLSILVTAFSINAFAVDPFTFDYDNQSIDVAFADLLGVLFTLLHGAGTLIVVSGIIKLLLAVSNEDPNREKHISTTFLGMMLMGTQSLLLTLNIFI